jgi:hypothetical protein
VETIKAPEMIGIALLAMVIGGLVRAFRPEYSRLTLVNRSGQSISRVVVRLSGEPSVITDLASGASATVPFPLRDDERTNVAGARRNGTAIRAKLKIAGNPK